MLQRVDVSGKGNLVVGVTGSGALGTIGGARLSGGTREEGPGPSQG